MGYKNTISSNLIETEQGLFWKGNLYMPANIDNITKVIEGVSLTDVADFMLLAALTNGKRFYITKIDIIPDKVTGLVTTPVISAGYLSPLFDNVIPVVDLFKITSVDTYLSTAMLGATPVVPANTALVLKKKQVAVATDYVVSIRVMGYYK